MSEPIYLIDTEGRTPAQVAIEFARNYFDEPREVDWIKRDHKGTTFALKDGVRVYQITLQRAVQGKSPAMYAVSVESE
jgi:hypothetical protein